MIRRLAVALWLVVWCYAPAWAQTRVVRAAAGEYQIFVPVSGKPASSVRYHLKRWATQVWGLQGIYVVEASGAELQISDALNTSVNEYAFDVGRSGAVNANAFSYTGMGHGYETLTGETLQLDGSSVLGWSIGQSSTGTTFTVAQTTTTQLPFEADGSIPPSPVLAVTGTVTHTFTAAGVQVDHTHVMLSGFVCRTFYSSLHATHAANFNRYSVNGGAAATLLTDGSIVALGRAVLFEVWNTSAHNYRARLTLPTGGPEIGGSWATSPTTPNEVGLEMSTAYGKARWQYLAKATFADAVTTGSTAHRAVYAVVWVDTPPGPTAVQVNRLVSGW